MSLNAQKTREFSPNVLRRIKLRTRLFVTFLDRKSTRLNSSHP